MTYIKSGATIILDWKLKKTIKEIYKIKQLCSKDFFRYKNNI